MLTEAHQSGGSLAVNFVRRSRIDGKPHPHRTESTGTRLPSAIVRWAGAHGVRLDRRETRWDHETGERLLVAAARLPATLRALLPATAVAAPTICAAVSTGTWPALDVEMVLRCARDATRILTGAVPVHDRVRYLADQHVVRAAMVMSSLLRHLQRSGQPSASDEDDTIADVDVAIGDRGEADRTGNSLPQVRFTSSSGQPLNLGWPCLAGPRPHGSTLQVRVLPVEVDLLAQAAPALVPRMSPAEALVVPADALARTRRLGDLFDAAATAAVTVVAAPDYTTSMDVAIAARLDRSRMSRR